MTSIVTYLQRVSKDIPIYAKAPWLGTLELDSARPPEPAAGKQVSQAKCTPCHGPERQGTRIAPPLSIEIGPVYNRILTWA